MNRTSKTDEETKRARTLNLFLLLAIVREEATPVKLVECVEVVEKFTPPGKLLDRAHSIADDIHILRTNKSDDDFSYSRIPVLSVYIV